MTTSLSKQSVILGVDDVKISTLTQDDSLDLNYSTLDTIGFSFDSAKVDLNVLSILEGGDIETVTTDAGETAHKYSLGAESTPKYFKLEGMTKYTGGEAGDFHFTLFKCRANSIVVEYKTQDYAIVSVVGIAIPTTNDGKIKEFVINKTATPIA